MRLSAIILLVILGWSGVAQAQSTPPASSAPKFITISNNAILSSRLIGLNIQSASGKDMGKIEDVAFEGGQIIGVVLSVGELLGSGQHYVAVDPSAISMNTDLEQLKSAPEFRYEGKRKR